LSVYLAMKRSGTRQHIIQTASDLFYQQGYNLTGINEVIAKAGIAKATLYSHFRSKEELCVAYLQHRNEGFLKNIRAFAEAKPQGEARILAVLGYLLDFFQDDAFNGCWCIRTFAELPRDDEQVKAEIRAEKGALLALIQELVTDSFPALSPEKQTSLAQTTYVLYEGAVMESYMQNENWPIHSAITTLRGILSLM